MTRLSQIKSPEELRKLPEEELPFLAQELRERIVDVVSRQGGHLASSLGAVELTIALHYVFHTPADKILWDVGHQAYAHKILTGRNDAFAHLRNEDGCSGFPTPEESVFDPYIAGHAGTAIPAAVGFAVAARAQHREEKAIAVVGDGALNCGLSLEGLNHIAESRTAPIIILNDNRMSISGNVGAIPSYLNRIITGESYNRFRALSRALVRKLPHHEELYSTIKRLESSTKSLFLPGTLFEELGIRYLGPIDGHELKTLIRVFRTVQKLDRPVLLHVVTEKGRGYRPAAEAPEAFHGVGFFEAATGKLPEGHYDFSAAFGEAVVEAAEEDDAVCAITAAMGAGTGLSIFAERFPERFYDVGIAEGYAGCFAAALAAGGMRPVLALYSTFLQRALDQVFHDIALQNLPVILGIDRAGVTGDGPTHCGFYDLGFLREMPNWEIYAPRNEVMLKAMFRQAHQRKTCPAAIRYPRGSGAAEPKEPVPVFGRAEILKEGRDLAVWALGAECHTALAAAEILQKEYGLDAMVVDPRYIVPFDAELLKQQAEAMPIFTVEDHCVVGGLGSLVSETLRDSTALKGCFGWPKEILHHGSVVQMRRRYGMTADFIAREIARKTVKKTNQTE